MYVYLLSACDNKTDVNYRAYSSVGAPTHARTLAIRREGGARLLRTPQVSILSLETGSVTTHV